MPRSFIKRLAVGPAMFLASLLMTGCVAGGSASTPTDPSSGPAVMGEQVKQTLVTPLDNNIGGYLEYLPGDYATSGHTYPLIIFLHGSGERGDGSSADLDKVASNGLPRLLRDKKLPAGFTVKSGTFSFIVISPQIKANTWPPQSSLMALLDHLKNENLRFDPKRVYVTGLSMGGGITWNYAISDKNLPSIAAIVPICGAMDSNDAGAKRMADAKLPIWAFHNDGDPSVPLSYTQHWMDAINSHAPAVPPRKTIFSSDHHDAWTTAYDPDYWETINGEPMNVYEWLLNQRKP